MTGCQSHETSADYSPTGHAADAYGALTHTLTTALRQLREANDGGSVAHKCVCFFPACLLSMLNCCDTLHIDS